MAVFPTTLQSKISRNNFKEEPPDNIIRSSMDVGPDKVRKRTSSNVRKLTINIEGLTTSEVDTLDTFYISNAAASFDITHPRTSTVVKARFVEPPEYRYDETIWDSSLNLEILP